METEALEAALSSAHCAPDILEQSLEQIEADKVALMTSLIDDREERDNLLSKLHGYRCVQDLNDLEYGHYIRWITSDRNSNYKLTNGGFVAEIKITENGPAIVCKNGRGRLFQCNYNNCIVLRKLTRDEGIILRALELAKRLPSD